MAVFVGAYKLIINEYVLSINVPVGCRYIIINNNQYYVEFFFVSVLLK